MDPHREVALIDYRRKGTKVQKCLDGSYIIQLRFFLDVEDEDFEFPPNFLKRWCNDTDPEEVIEHIIDEFGDNYVDGSARWHKSTSLIFKIKHNDDWWFGEMNAESLTRYFDDESLEDGVWEGADNFWVISAQNVADFITETS